MVTPESFASTLSGHRRFSREHAWIFSALPCGLPTKLVQMRLNSFRI
jgi:hypothetical protein